MSRRLSIRWGLILCVCLAVTAGQTRAWLGGSFSGQPEEMEAHLGPVAQDLIKRAFVDMYVLKRTLRDPETGRRLPAGIFTANPGLKAL